MSQRIVRPKLCKFRELDVAHIEMIKARNGFHEDITAIRFALHLAARLEVPPLIKKTSGKSKKDA